MLLDISFTLFTRRYSPAHQENCELFLVNADGSLPLNTLFIVSDK